MPAEVQYVGYGIGSHINGTIYLHRALKEYPQLHDAILQHELKHANGENPDWHENWDWRLWGFFFTHPSAWVQFLPIWIKKGKTSRLQVSVSWMMVMLWLSIIAWLCLVFAVVKWII